MATTHIATRPPLPPFTRENAIQKVRLAEDGWNTRDPGKVALAYAIDSRWRNRSEFINGRNEIVAFLSRKWAKELNYRLIKELWAFTGNRIAVRFAYEWHDDSGHWFRSYGNENWEFNESGFMLRRFASINDLPIKEAERKFFWPLGRRPDETLVFVDAENGPLGFEGLWGAGALAVSPGGEHVYAAGLDDDAVVAFALITKGADLLMLVLAWLFVLTRLVHAAIHIGPNKLRWRTLAFALGFLIITIMWIKLAIHVSSAGLA